MMFLYFSQILICHQEGKVGRWPRLYCKDYKIFSTWIYRILFCESASLLTYRMDSWGLVGKGAHWKCDLITEVAEFPLCSEGKCYKSVIALPSMCDLQDLRMCEFPEASVLKYSIPPTPAGCVWGGGGREDLHFILWLSLDDGWLGTKPLVGVVLPFGTFLIRV